jgi:ABC-2 type transport system permease protein
VTGRRTASFAGTATLVRLILRRDRVRLPIWVGSILALTVVTAAMYESLLESEEDLAGRLELLTANPAVQVFASPGHGLDEVSLDNLGPALVNELSSFTAVLLALMSIFLVVRHTRQEEESGRAELVQSAVVGPYSATTAALVVAGGANATIAVVLAGAFVLLGLEPAGSLAFGVSMGAVGVAAAGLGLLAAQLSRFSRGATGLAVGAFAVLFSLRALGDIFDNGLNWLSPVGWAQAMRPFAGERWWPLLLVAALTAALMAGALGLARRRDTGGALLPDRGGRARAPWSLGSTLGLSLRLQRASLAGWGVGLLAGGLVIGAIGTEADDLLADIEIYQEYFARFEGVSFADATFASFLVFLAAVVGGATIASALVPNREEAAKRAEPVLAAPISQTRWLLGHVAVAVAGSVVLLALAGLGAGVVHAASTGEVDQVGRLVGATLVHAPAVWVLGGATVALYGVAPRAVGVSWALLAYAAVISVYGPLLGPPDLAYDLSPFEHVPSLPAERFELVPVAVLTAIAAGLVAVGVIGFRRRDLV